MTTSVQSVQSVQPVEDDTLTGIDIILTDEELFKKGCTIQLKTSVWGARKKLPKESMDVKDATKDMFTGTKYLISREHTARMESIRSHAWKYLYNFSLKFDIEGFVYIPKKYIPDVHQKLLEFKEDFYEEVDEFIPHYPEYVEEARFKLGKLFNFTEYPDPSTISNYFRFKWAFLRVSVPGPESNVLSPEMYIEAENQFKDILHDACTEAVRGLTAELSKTLDHLYNQISGSGAKRFQQRSIDKLTNFVNEMKHMNITNDVELAAVSDKIQSLVGGVEAKDLKKDDNFRMGITTGMEQIRTELSKMVEKKPRKLMV